MKGLLRVLDHTVLIWSDDVPTSCHLSLEHGVICAKARRRRHYFVTAFILIAGVYLYLSICALLCYWVVTVAKRHRDTLLDF